MRITKGEDKVKTYNDEKQDSGNAIPRHFCSECASPLYSSNGDFGKTIAVYYSALDDFEMKSPEVEYYSKDRTHWVHPVEGALAAHTKPGRDE